MSQQGVPQRKRHWPVAGLLPLCASLPLLAHAYIGSFSRLMADDYCSAVEARARGVFGATHYWYMTWSGRFIAHFLDGIAGVLGPRATPYYPAVGLLLWIAALVLLIHRA